MHFYVYKHVFILKENRKITRFFLTLRDSDKNIVAFTNFHIFIKSGKNRKSKKVTCTGEARFYAVCKFLNYAFFDSEYKIHNLNAVTVDIISAYLNAYGMGELNENDKYRKQTTVDSVIDYIIDFFDEYLLYANQYKIKTKLKRSELYIKKQIYSKKFKKFIDVNVPRFDVTVISNNKTIFRDIFEGVFTIIMNTIIEEDTDILMLAASSAFAGLRPSEACNLLQEDSPLGNGILFYESNAKIDEIILDLDYERQLRSDGKSVGDIKKERKQKVYPAFIPAFAECYNIYMKHMHGRKYEEKYAPLTINSQGKAMTYDTYLSRFKKIVVSAREKMLHSDDPKVCMYGKMLFTNNLTPHIFRHWFSVKLTLFGEDVAGLQYWRGDKSPNSALTYIANKSELVKQLNDVSSELYDFSSWMAKELHDND